MEKLDAYTRVKQLVDELNKHTELYDAGRPIISDTQWDRMYFELVELERQFPSLVLPNSPTQRVNYTVVNELTKVEHNHPMLSLDKTKDIEEIKSFVGNKDWIAMLKMDGLTCSLLYEDGKLIRAETRGDGYIGEDITHNAMVIPSIPKKIPYTDRLVVDCEIICKLDDFTEFANEYKNARNFASGSIRLLDSKECAKRKITFVAWDVIGDCAYGDFDSKTLLSKLCMLMDFNFTVVPCLKTMPNIERAVELLKDDADIWHYPIDGLVFKWNNCAEYESAGRTDHHFRGGLAYKLYDELYETKLIDVEWTMGKTNTLTPTAIFETVNIDGTDVSRASLHNISVIKNLGLTHNCTVKVYKANAIIPQIDSCLQDGDSAIIIPKCCPVCGGETTVVKENESEVLVCTNSNCSGKLLGRLKFFVSKPAMNIDGLSEATLEVLINKGWVKNFKDIYYLYRHGREWEQLDGFGERSVAKILDAIDVSRKVSLSNFICALSIDGIGKAASKTISDAFDGDFDAFYKAFKNNYNWASLQDIGDKTASNITKYLTENEAEIVSLASEMNFIKPTKTAVATNPFGGKTLCVTGKLNHFTRDSINEKITSLGAKAAGSVSSKTDYLITNEASGSSKYKKAQELNIPIITEEEFLNMIGD
jgi:DNA ligase (NAD+)